MVCFYSIPYRVMIYILQLYGIANSEMDICMWIEVAVFTSKWNFFP